MLIRTPSDILPSEITPQALYLRRREFLRQAAALGLAGTMLTGSGSAFAQTTAPVTEPGKLAKLPGKPSPLSTLRPSATSRRMARARRWATRSKSKPCGRLLMRARVSGPVRA